MAPKHTILLVDDENSIIKALLRLFRKEDYHTLTASSGQEGIDLLKKVEKPISLIISDQRMPEMTGAQFLEKAKVIFPDAVRFLLTGYSDMDAIVAAVNKGEIHRYLTKPWNDDDLLLQVRQALEQFELVLENRRLLDLTNKQNIELNELNENLERKIDERTREIKHKNKELEEANRKLEKSFIDTIRLLTALVETLNPRLGKYMMHVAQLAREVAKEYGFDREQLDQIEIAGMVHDIGLIGFPERIWAKDENDMSETELKAFSQHPLIGQISLESVERLSEVGQMVLYHHECYDGTGFPDRLKGCEIPLGSRIIKAVGDYCKIMDTWPRETSQVIDRAEKYLGRPATKNFLVRKPEEMIKAIAEKIILLGVHEKYDIEVATKLIEKTMKTEATKEGKNQEGEEKTLWINLEELEEGMILEKDLCLADGRLVLVKGSKLGKSSIKSIQRLGEQKLINNQLSIKSNPEGSV